MIWLPNLEETCLLHQKIVKATGGSADLRDRGLVESALFRAQGAFGGVEAYPTLEAKAAALCCGLVQNHGFVDGNKRIGVTSMLLVLRRNGVTLHYTQQELTRLGLEAAKSRWDVPEVLAWIVQHAP